MTTLLTAKDILAADDMEYIDVDVPEWGGTIRLRDLNAKDRIEMRAVFFGDGSGETPAMEKMATLLSKCIVNENSERVFTQDQIKDLEEKNPKIIDKLFGVAADLLGISTQSAEDAKKN